MGNASICKELLHVSPRQPLPLRGLPLWKWDSSPSSECLCPTWKRTFFWLLPNPYFLSKPDSNHGCASMCRTKSNPGSKSIGQLARTQKKQIWDPGSFSEGSLCEPVFVGNRSLAILNSGSGSGGERRSLREKGVSIKDRARPLHTQGEKGLQGHQAEQPHLGGCLSLWAKAPAWAGFLSNKSEVWQGSGFKYEFNKRKPPGKARGTSWSCPWLMALLLFPKF